MATKDDVLKVAQLARIQIEDANLENIEKKFHAILDYFTFLKEANTENVNPLYHGVEELELREDIPEEALDREKLLQNAPEQMEHCFKIPKVVGAIE